MLKDIKSIKIGSIWNQGRGATLKDEINAKPALGEEAKLSQPLQTDLTLIRLQDGVAVILKNLHTAVEPVCVRCLEKFTFPLQIISTEREFFEGIPDRNYDPFEVFLINKQEMSVDLTEMLRQEIILHFPMIPVCSERCKGLCPSCHINLNSAKEHSPDCLLPKEPVELVADSHKPFAHLKDFLNNH